MNITKRTGIIASITAVAGIAAIVSAIKDKIDMNNRDYKHIYDIYAEFEHLVSDEMLNAQKDAVTSMGIIDATTIIVEKVKDLLDNSNKAQEFIDKCFEDDLDSYIKQNLIVSKVDICGFRCIIVTEWENDNKIVEILLPRDGNHADYLDLDQIATMMLF